jgi:hypothetical protein
VRGKRESKGVRTTTRMSVTITATVLAMVNASRLGLRLFDGQGAEGVNEMSRRVRRHDDKLENERGR